MTEICTDVFTVLVISVCLDTTVMTTDTNYQQSILIKGPTV